MGPFSSDKKRIDLSRDTCAGQNKLADTGYTDILSLGTSQLTQSNFGEDWEGRLNGGGVPVNRLTSSNDLRRGSTYAATYAARNGFPNLPHTRRRSTSLGMRCLSGGSIF